MSEPYTLRIFVADGDPSGVKIVDRMNWTGVGIAFPRSAWERVQNRQELRRPGVYILSGTAEDAADELPTIYIGQGEEVGARIEKHDSGKVFWDSAYAFVSTSGALNRAHITWLEHALILRAERARQCHLDNATQPREPNLSESERADTDAFLNEILRILPLVGVHVFELPKAITVGTHQPSNVDTPPADDRDTVIVPAQQENFKTMFVDSHCWYAIRIAGGMLPRIRYVAAYQTAPVSAITHVAPVERIEPFGDAGKYRLIFSEPAKTLPTPIPFADARIGSLQGPRYTSYEKLLSAKSVAELVSPPPNSPQKPTSRRMPRPPAEPARAARDGRRHAACRSLRQNFSFLAASGAPLVRSRVKRLAA